jgi:hypothetical protein
VLGSNSFSAVAFILSKYDMLWQAAQGQYSQQL